MKKILALAFLSPLFFSCNEEPKLTNQEKASVDSLMLNDQKAQDSLEAAIMAQMEAADADSANQDSL